VAICDMQDLFCNWQKTVANNKPFFQPAVTLLLTRHDGSRQTGCVCGAGTRASACSLSLAGTPRTIDRIMAECAPATTIHALVA